MSTPTPPETVEEFHRRLQGMSEDLPKRLKQCANYLTTNADRIAVSTVAELARGAEVQPSAIIRFCQIMGFSGFSDMQRLFRSAFAPGLPDYATRLTNLRERGAGSPSALLAEFTDAGRKSLENLTNTLDSRALDEAVTKLSSAGMIHVIGLHRAYPVATYLTYAFEKMQIPAMLHDGSGRLDHRCAMREGDAVLAITFAPYSSDTIDLSLDAHQRDLPVIAITDTISSPLNKAGIVTLTVAEADFGAFRALSATLSLAITLAVAVGTNRNKSE